MLFSETLQAPNSLLAGDPFPTSQLATYKDFVDKCLRARLTGAPLDCHERIVQSTYGNKAMLEILDYPYKRNGDALEAQYFTDPAARRQLVEILARIATGWQNIRLYSASGSFDHDAETLGRRRATETLLQYLDDLNANTILNTLARVANQEVDPTTLKTAIRGIKLLILSTFSLLPNFVTIALTALQGLASDLEPDASVRDAARRAQAEIAAKTAPAASDVPKSSGAPRPPTNPAVTKALVIVPIALATVAGLALIRRGFTRPLTLPPAPTRAPFDERYRARSRTRS